LIGQGGKKKVQGERGVLGKKKKKGEKFYEGRGWVKEDMKEMGYGTI